MALVVSILTRFKDIVVPTLTYAHTKISDSKEQKPNTCFYG